MIYYNKKERMSGSVRFGFFMTNFLPVFQLAFHVFRKNSAFAVKCGKRDKKIQKYIDFLKKHWTNKAE